LVTISHPCLSPCEDYEFGEETFQIVPRVILSERSGGSSWARRPAGHPERAQRV